MSPGYCKLTFEQVNKVAMLKWTLQKDQNQQINTKIITNIYFKKVKFFRKKRVIQNSEKTACQKVVAMVTSN